MDIFWSPISSQKSNWHPRSKSQNKMPMANSEPVTAEGKAGTVLFYSSHMPHSPQAFTNPRKQRAVLFYAVGRRDTSTWTLTEKRDIQERGRLRPFLTKTTAKVRSLFGWPNPGDDFYTPETLRLIKNAYPEMNLSPYY